MFLGFLISGVFLGLACIYPDNLLSPLTVFILLCLFFRKYLQSKVLASHLLVTGFAFHLTAMWWLAPTMERFGGMPFFAAGFLMLLHSLLSSFQFYFLPFLGRILSRIIDRGVAAVIGWILLELFFPRLFPWGIGNFFISVEMISAWAEVFGVTGVSLLVLVIALGLAKLLEGKGKVFNFGLLSLILVVFIGGNFLTDRAKSLALQASKIKALVVQGNLSIEQKGKQDFLEVNLDKYRELSNNEVASQVDLVIWPESVVSSWLDQSHEGYSNLSPDPFPGLSSPLLYGGLTLKREDGELSIFNSALVRSPHAQVRTVYSKKVLMPFGEFVPFAEVFPWIRNMTPIKRDFSRGKISNPATIKTRQGVPIQLGISICYEDLSVELARIMAQNGADLLVNLTNDAWYGNSPAPFQHDLLARFRAIETRRYLIRSTNTGLTSLISVDGSRVQTLPLFKEVSAVFEVPIINYDTIFVRFGGLSLFALCTILMGLGFLTKKKA